MNIETHPGISATTMTKDRFQAQVAVVPDNMLPASGSDSDNSPNINTNDLGSNFRVSPNSELDWSRSLLSKNYPTEFLRFCEFSKKKSS